MGSESRIKEAQARIKATEQKYGISSKNDISYDSIDTYKKTVGAGRGLEYDHAYAKALGINKPKTNTAMDMQKKKEDRLEVKSTVNAAEIKRDRTKKQYEDYINSEEYRKKLAESVRAQQLAMDRDETQVFSSTSDMMPFAPKQDQKEYMLRLAKEAAEQEYNEAEDRKRFEADMEVITGLPEEQRLALERYSASKYGGRDIFGDETIDEMMEEYGRPRLDELERTFSRDKNAKRAEEVDAKAREFVSKRGGRGTLANILSVPVQAYSGIIGTGGQLAEMMIGTGGYKTQDPNAYGTIGQTLTGAIRGQTSENITEDLGDGFVGKAANIGYQGVMVAADSVARAYMGGGAFGGATLAATGTFSQTMADASRNGATPAQAALLATTTAGIEALTEKIPLDNLIRTAKGKGFNSAILNALRQAGIEATTEEVSLICTILAEAAILQEKSGYQRDVMTAIMDGASVDDAVLQASQNIVDEAINTALVSMISGGASSLAGSYADYRGWFAEEQAQNNPALNQPKQGDVIKSKEALLQKYGQADAQQTQTAETPQTTPVQQEAAQPAMQQEAPQQAQQTTTQQSEQQNLTDIFTEIFTQMRENNGKASNRMAESVMSDPAAMLELGIAPEGTKAEQRRRVKEEMEKLFQKQNPQTETTRNVPEAEPMQATETSEQATMQASTPTADMQMGANDQSADGGQQTEAPQGKPEMQRDRINAVREQAVPVTDPQGNKVSEFAGNAYQSALTPDSFTESIQRLVEEGQVSHDVQTNEESLRKGAEMIAKAGTERKAVNEIRDFANSGKFTPEHIAMGTLLYQDLTAQIEQQSKSGNVDPNLKQDAEDVFVSLQQMATNSGRALQLYNLFRKMTPDSQVRVMENEVQRNIEKMQKAGTVKKDYQTSIDPDLTNMYRQAAEEYQKASGPEAKRTAEQKMLDIQSVIYASEAAKLPTTFKAKWDAWRYMAMLGNVKTQIRNFAGNTLMLPYTEAKRAVGAILEKGISKDQRTKAVFVDRQLMNWAKNDIENVRTVLEGSAKLGDSTAVNPLAEDIKTFGDSWIGERFNDMQGIINKVVSGGDMLFKNGEYARSLAGFLKARGYTAADIQNNLVNQDILNEARNYAVNEALKATFNDTNMLSDALANGLRYKGDNPAMKAINMLGEGIMPFRKTPANVVMRFKDYSFAGLAQGVWNLAANVRNGKVTAATALDQISSGLTGTAMMQLGYVLAGGIAGVKITGSGADEDEQRQGHQNYALEFSVNGQEYSYTVDWASPANLPLFLGANLREMQDAPNTESFLTASANAARGALEPLLQLSCLSSLNDMVEKARYAEEGEAIYTFLANAATGYLTQGIPALARQTTQAANEYKQTTLVTSDDPVISDVQKGVAGLGVGNPYKTDKVNAWGEKENTGTAFERIINSFFNPGNLKKIDNSAVEQEISRLNATGENVSPDYAPKVITYTDKDGNLHKDQRLTEEQYQTFAKTQGQTARQLVEELIKSRSYETMSDEQKAEAINLAYTYARETAEKAAFPDSLGYSEKWLMETDAAKNKAGYILNKVGTAMLSGAMGKIDSAWDNNYSAENVKSLSDQLAKDFEAYSKMPRADKTVVYEGLTGTTKKYVEAREKGVSHDDFLKTAKAINDVKGTGKYDKNTGKNAVRDIDKRAAIAGVSNLTPGARDILMKAYMTDYDPTDESPTKTEPKYDFIRQEMGLSAKDYVDSYRVYLDVSGKNNEIKGIMNAINCDYATARKLRNLYGGWYEGSDWKNYIADY